MSTNSDFMLGFSSAIFATPDAIRTAVYKAASDLGSTAEVRSDGTNLAVIVTADAAAYPVERTAVAVEFHAGKDGTVLVDGGGVVAISVGVSGYGHRGSEEFTHAEPGGTRFSSGANLIAFFDQLRTELMALDPNTEFLPYQAPTPKQQRKARADESPAQQGPAGPLSTRWAVWTGIAWLVFLALWQPVHLAYGLHTPQFAGFLNNQFIYYLVPVVIAVLVGFLLGRRQLWRLLMIFFLAGIGAVVLSFAIELLLFKDYSIWSAEMFQTYGHEDGGTWPNPPFLRRDHGYPTPLSLAGWVLWMVTVVWVGAALAAVTARSGSSSEPDPRAS